MTAQGDIPGDAVKGLAAQHADTEDGVLSHDLVFLLRQILRLARVPSGSMSFPTSCIMLENAICSAFPEAQSDMKTHAERQVEDALDVHARFVVLRLRRDGHHQDPLPDRLGELCRPVPDDAFQLPVELLELLVLLLRQALESPVLHDQLVMFEGPSQGRQQILGAPRLGEISEHVGAVDGLGGALEGAVRRENHPDCVGFEPLDFLEESDAVHLRHHLIRQDHADVVLFQDLETGPAAFGRVFLLRCRFASITDLSPRRIPAAIFSRRATPAAARPAATLTQHESKPTQRSILPTA